MTVTAELPVQRDDVHSGLRATPKRLPSRLLYDDIGAELREQITGIDDWYLARTELRLLDAQLAAIAADVGIAPRVVELGAPLAIRTKRLLRGLDHPAAYIALDQCSSALRYVTDIVQRELPALDIQTFVTDFTRPFKLPSPRRPIGRTLAFVPGAQIDNLEPFEAVAVLATLRRYAAPNGRLLLSADGTRDRDALLRAYDDRDGVTAAFNKNALKNLERERGTCMDATAFEHRAVWNDSHCRVELHLVSQRAQRINLGAIVLDLAAGEPIVTAYAYKHDIHAMRGLLYASGWQVRDLYEAEEQPMRLWLCEPRGG